MADPTADIQKLNRMYSGMAQEIRKHIHPVSAELDAMQKIRRSIQLTLLPAVNTINAMHKAMEPFLEQQRQFQRQIDEMAREISHQMHTLPARNREALCMLAQHGWYFDPELPYAALFEIAKEFKSGNERAAYSELCDYFEARLDIIEERLNSMAPNRIRIIKSALAAHRRGEYGLSIPVFLAQAEGLCLDFTGFQLYSKKPNQLRSLLSDASLSPFRESLLAPLLNPAPLNLSQKERDTASGVLNRHAILHGESTDYDTRLNSCRAISLLIFVAWVLGNPLGSEVAAGAKMPSSHG